MYIQATRPASCWLLARSSDKVLAAQMLFFFLSVTFFLLSAGETHPILHKVGPGRGLLMRALLHAHNDYEVAATCVMWATLPRAPGRAESG